MPYGILAGSFNQDQFKHAPIPIIHVHASGVENQLQHHTVSGILQGMCIERGLNARNAPSRWPKSKMKLAKETGQTWRAQ